MTSNAITHLGQLVYILLQQTICLTKIFVRFRQHILTMVYYINHHCFQQTTLWDSWTWAQQTKPMQWRSRKETKVEGVVSSGILVAAVLKY